MSLETVLLRALLRLSQRRSTFANEGSPRPFARVEADRMAIKRALGLLAKKGLVYRAANGEPRLTLAGFTVATAIVAATEPKALRGGVKKRPVAPVLPFVRRAVPEREDAKTTSSAAGVVEPSKLVSA